MSKANSNLTAERARELFSYDPISGLMTRKITSGGRRAGTEAGCINTLGYKVARADGTLMLVHRIAWLITHGAISRSLEIDHINGIRDDNRICNLRLVDVFTNMQNQHIKRLPVSGFRGVTPHRDKWKAQIIAHRKHYAKGGFSTPQEANEWYLTMRAELHARSTPPALLLAEGS